jgi:hypothetical protein
MTSEKGEIVRRGQRRVGAVEAGPWQLERLGSKAELRSLTNGPPSRTNVCTRRAPPSPTLGKFRTEVSSCLLLNFQRSIGGRPPEQGNRC